MTAGAKRAIGLKLGLWPAMVVALTPILIALLHLLPTVTATDLPAIRSALALQLEQPRSPGSAHHPAPRVIGIEELDALIASGADHCPPRPGAPAQQAQPSCPLCYWLQGLHVLPPPDGPLLAQPRERRLAFIARSPAAPVAVVGLAAQPRGPPASLQA